MTVARWVSCPVLILLPNSFEDLCLKTVFFDIVIIRCLGMFCFLVGPFYLFPYFVNGDSVKCWFLYPCLFVFMFVSIVCSG